MFSDIDTTGGTGVSTVIEEDFVIPEEYFGGGLAGVVTAAIPRYGSKIFAPEIYVIYVSGMGGGG